MSAPFCANTGSPEASRAAANKWLTSVRGIRLFVVWLITVAPVLVSAELSARCHLNATDGQRVVIQAGGAINHCQPPLGKPGDCLRVNSVLLSGNTRGQYLGSIPGQHRHNSLNNHGATIELFSHKMHADTVTALTCIQYSLMGMSALVGWQQRGMDVDQSASVVLNKS